MYECVREMTSAALICVSVAGSCTVCANLLTEFQGQELEGLPPGLNTVLPFSPAFPFFGSLLSPWSEILLCHVK